MLDIQFGDLLINGSKKYPVKGVERWSLSGAGLDALFTVVYSTQRAPAISSGKRGAAVTNLSNVLGTELMPVQGELEMRPALPTAAQSLECFLQDSGATLRVIVDDVKPNE